MGYNNNKMRRYQQPLIEASKHFNSAAIEPFDTLEVPEHLTAVALLPTQIRESLAQFSRALHEQEPSLLLVEPENYHVTLAAAPAGTDHHRFMELIEDVLRGRPIELDLSGVVLDPVVVAVPAFPKEHELYEARQHIAKGLGEAIARGPKTELGWVSLARFSQPPSVAMVGVALRSIQQDWGQIQITSVSVYSTAHKHLDDATKIATISR